MIIAIMQPYIFPYIGYFQLINLADKFVIYDDVNFINRSWINRNRILASGQSQLFTIPLKEASQNKLIMEVGISDATPWRKKLLRTIQQSYRKSPNYLSAFPVIDEIINFEADSVSNLILHSLKKICAHMEINTEIIASSSIYRNAALSGQDRILDICVQEKAETYINPIGGVDLYERSRFQAGGINLRFVQSAAAPYPQFRHAFVPWLSIIDVLMFNDQEGINTLLGQYKLV